MLTYRKGIESVYNNEKKVVPRFGDIYYAALTGGHNIQGGNRPVVIAQNNIGNKYSTTVEVIPMSARISKAAYLPTHVLVHSNLMNGLNTDSIVLTEQVVTINKEQLIGYIGHLSADAMLLIGKARAIQSPWPQ